MSSYNENPLTHDNRQCSHTATSSSSFTQTLDELDFSRSIHEACRMGDLNKVKRYLNSPTKSQSLHQVDPYGYTPLVSLLFLLFLI